MGHIGNSEQKATALDKQHVIHIVDLSLFLLSHFSLPAPDTRLGITLVILINIIAMIITMIPLLFSLFALFPSAASPLTPVVREPSILAHRT